MKTWFKEYRDAMYRTRAIGVVGAGIMVAATVLEILRIFNALSIAEGPFHKDLLWNVLGLLTFYATIGVLFIARIAILLRPKDKPYYLQAAIWICSATAVIAWTWWNAPT